MDKDSWYDKDLAKNQRAGLNRSDQVNPLGVRYIRMRDSLSRQSCIALLVLFHFGQSVFAQSLLPDDEAELALRIQMTAELLPACSQRAPALEARVVEAVARVKQRHQGLEIRGKRHLESLRINEAQVLAKLAAIKKTLAAMDEQGAARYCLEAIQDAEKLGGQNSSEVAKRKFDEELLSIEFSQGVQCSELERRIQAAARGLLPLLPTEQNPTMVPNVVDQFTLYRELGVLETAAKGCYVAQGRAEVRSIAFPGRFSLLLDATAKFMDTLHPVRQLEKGGIQATSIRARQAARQVLTEQ